MVWTSCDGATSIELLADAFERKFNVNNGLDVLLSGLKQLEACQLLETPIDLPDIAAAGRTVSRRAVVAGGSVLMPAVISMLAPTPAAAKSKKDKDDKKIEVDKKIKVKVK